MDKITQLRDEFKKHQINAYIIPSQDEYLNEYVPECFRRLEWLTGFTGSAGAAVVTTKKAAFFTDGRYVLQAKREVPNAYKRFNTADCSLGEWLCDNLPNGAEVGYDPWLHTPHSIKRLKEKCDTKKIVLRPVDGNLIDGIWPNKPTLEKELAVVHPDKFSGRSVRAKIKHILLDNKADSIALTSPSSICWLFNMRGKDVKHTPLLLSYAILHHDGSGAVFVDPWKIPQPVRQNLGRKISVLAIKDLAPALASLKGRRVQIDPNTANAWFFDRLKEANAEIIEKDDPCILPKACKNKVEIKGAKRAHLRDGVALTKFMYWLEQEIPNGKVTEIIAAKKLAQLRAVGEHFQDLSFETISGVGAHGAIVHYRATELSSAPMCEEEMYLIDSGAQYLDGTTDVTRTIALGGKPTREQRERFTLVLKGHIALASIAFPEGTRGCDLDVLARAALWRAGLDYDHGTGHGVGSYSGVHEGPQGISKRSTAELLPGMILSNEPGYYKDGAYGIRIENLVLVIEAKGLGEKEHFLGFETLTLAPIDRTLVEIKMLDSEELQWLNQYHTMVRKKLSPFLSPQEKRWLEQKTKVIR